MRRDTAEWAAAGENKQSNTPEQRDSRHAALVAL